MVTKWYDHNADYPPWIKALADVRRMATPASITPSDYGRD
jgi:hypothetical protein